MALPWDHENRLTAVETEEDVTGDANRWRRELIYDGLGRLRIRKDYDWLSGYGWYPIRTTYYIYDGWLLVQERSSPSYPTATYVWGPDLSGTVGGAGGIGGLLARSTGYNRSTGTWSTHRYYHCDGMGNVMAMIDADGNMTAAYRYDPYGRLRSWTGPEASSNPFRFSTKLWLDFGPVSYGNAGEFNMTYGLYYYGYRYYAPELQRWISRDPVGEWGGYNLYSFVWNNPFLFIDLWGWEPWYKKPWYEWQWIDSLANWGAGLGDKLSLGITRFLRKKVFTNFYEGVVDPCSEAYKWGQWTGEVTWEVAWTVAGGMVGWRWAGEAAKGMEYSHWIPWRTLKRLGKAGKYIDRVTRRYKLNGNYVTLRRHYLHDPWRYPPMKKEITEALWGKKWNFIRQQIDRIPRFPVGIISGAVIGDITN